MKTFDTITFDLLESERQVNEFERLLEERPSLKEKTDILPFFRSRPHLSAMCGVLSPALVIGPVDRIALEYDLFGDYACDLALGDWNRKAYCFIEFEDAEPQSIFQKAGKKATREWGRRFEHGYSQVIDWFHKLTKMTEHPDFEARFGKRTIGFDGALVIGRDKDLLASELARLEWRQEHVVVHSKRIMCVTFDALLRLMQSRLKNVSLAREGSRLSRTPDSPPPPKSQ